MHAPRQYSSMHIGVKILGWGFGLGLGATLRSIEIDQFGVARAYLQGVLQSEAPEECCGYSRS